MDWNELKRMQKKLDERIMQKVSKSRTDIKDDKLLALMVELAELANETRCFKYWSEKGPNRRDEILEEYVDGIHFLISIGLDDTYEMHPLAKRTDQSLTEQFHLIFNAIQVFKTTPTQENYMSLFNDYLSLGQSLGFDEEDIFKAYEEKNQINHERQESGY